MAVPPLPHLPDDAVAVAVAVVESNLLGQTKLRQVLRGLPGVRLVAVVERPMDLPEPPREIPAVLLLDMAFAGIRARRIRELSALGWSVCGLSPGGLDSETDARTAGVVAVLRTPVEREELARCLSEVQAGIRGIRGTQRSGTRRGVD